MDIVKVTTSGQISIPKKLRTKIKADYFMCVIKDGGYFFMPVETENTKEKKYTMKDLKNWSFKDNDPDTDWSSKIDEIVYQL